MDSLTVFGQVLLLFAVARALGVTAQKLRQPRAVGELCAGIVLAAVISWAGPDVAFFASITGNPVIAHVAELGIFFLMLMAGIELKPSEIVEHSMSSLSIALGGMLLPLLLGVGLAWLVLPDVSHKVSLALLIGIAISISAIPETARIFADFNLLHAPVGRSVIAAAIFDDVFGLFLLAILSGLILSGAVPDFTALILLLVKIAVFFGVTIGLGVHVYRPASRRLRALQLATLEFSAIIGVALAYGVLAELLDLHWILGAFMAALHFEPERVGEKAWLEIRLIVDSITFGFLAPLFFTYIGLRVDLTAITGAPLFLVLLILIALVGKFVGAGLPALWTGLDRQEAAIVGIGMNARGAVELIVISIAYEARLFDQPGTRDPIITHLYSSLVLMAVVTTLLTPLMLRYTLRRHTPWHGRTGPDEIIKSQISDE